MKRIVSVGALVLVLWIAVTSTWGDDSVDGERPVVSVFGPWLGSDAGVFAASMTDFEDEVGVDVQYTGSLDFTGDLRRRVAAGVEAPDIAIIPQPGLVLELVDAGELEPLIGEALESVETNFDVERSALAIDGAVYAFPYRSIVKSLVWYRPDVFESQGWALPRSLEELHDLTEKIGATGDLAPWCFSIFSGGDTGWPATDWIEDLLLRRAGPDVYDEWAAGNRPHSDPAIEAVYKEVADLLLAEGRTVGGTRSILKTRVSDAAGPLFADPPGCALYKQANFATTWFPEGTTVGPTGTVDFFVLPGADDDQPVPLLTSSDLAVQFSGRPVVTRLMAYLASPRGAQAWANRGGYVSARTSIDPTRYYSELDRRFAQTLQDASATRLDASDLQPSAFRSALYDETTRWIAGQQSLEEYVVQMDELLAERADD